VVDTFAWTDGGTKTETTDRVLIYETVPDATVMAITEETAPVPPRQRHQFANGVCVTCRPAEAVAALHGRTSMPKTVSRSEYTAALDQLCDRYKNGATPALARQLNEALASYKAGVVVVEETAVSRPGARPVRETAAARPASRAGAAKPAKPSKKAARIARIVTEALTAAAAPSLPPGMKPATRPQPAAPAVPLHQVDVDQLGAMTAERLGAGAVSPFWCGSVRESAPDAPIRESELEQAARDLTTLSSDGLAKVLDASQRRAGHRSPIWAAA